MQQFGRYQLVRRLAVGGMAEVFLARSASLDGFEKEFAIKRIRGDLSGDEHLRSMFIDEARISMLLSHPNIVQVFDFGEADGSYYLAMEYVDGCDLRRLLAVPGVKGKGLTPALALIIVGEVLNGLAYAHAKHDRRGQPLDIVHRDISPHNVLVSLDGVVKLTDFGIAKAQDKLSKTNPGHILGKFAYMSPEQLRGDAVDVRTDVFACGILLWEMLTGESLYGDAARTRYFEKILEARVDAPSLFRRELSPELDALVLRAVARSPTDRPDSARVFEREVHAYLVRHHPEASLYDLRSFLAAHSTALQAPAAAGQANAAGAAAAPASAEPLSGTLIIDPAGQKLPLRESDVATGDLAPAQLDATETDAPTVVSPRPVILERLITKAAAEKKRPAALASNPAFEWTPEFIALVEAFRKSPSLWHLVRMAERCAAEKQDGAAVACFRVGAVKFAQRGLLAQALLCCRRMAELAGSEAVRGEIAALASLAGRSDAAVRKALFHAQGPVEQLLDELLCEVQPTTGACDRATPLLSLLEGPSLAELATRAPLKRFSEGSLILRQGERGRTMYLIARGRVLVWARTASGEHVSLSSLMDGDFFGENGFFTGAPRSANVEALDDVEVFEIDRSLYNDVMARHPAASSILLEFYRERIAEAVMAKSPVFGLLDAEDRRSLTKEFTPRVFVNGERVIEEGARSDHIFLIKDGEAEVFTEKAGTRTRLSVIGPGTLFGEIAAIHDIPRTATVVAKGRLEVLELPGAAFLVTLETRPDVKKLVLEEVTRRNRDNMDKLLGSRPEGPYT